MKKIKVKYGRRERYITFGVGALAIAGLASYGVVELVNYSRALSRETFVAAYQNNMSDVFSDADDPKPVVTEKWVAGELGYTVNKGPIRITSAYKTLFDEEGLKDLADWFYHDVAWGANGLSLNEVNFTTGVDRTGGGVTLGAHTSSRDGSNIFMSPDAFEQAYGVTDDTLQEFVVKKGLETTLQEDWEALFKASVTTEPVVNNVNQAVNDYLTANFNADASKPETTQPAKQYTKLTGEQFSNVLDDVFVDMLSDDFFDSAIYSDDALVSTSSWNQLLNHTYLGDGVFSNFVRKLQANTKNVVGELFNKAFNERFLLILAWKAVRSATGYAIDEDDVVNNSLADLYLQRYLLDLISDAGAVGVDERVAARVLVAPENWAARLETLKASYPANEAADIAAVLALFIDNYNQAKAFFAKDTIAQVVNFLRDKTSDLELIFRSALARLGSAPYSASDRARLMLDGRFATAVEVAARKEDQFLFSPESWTSLIASAYGKRNISIIADTPLKAFVHSKRDHLQYSNQKRTNGQATNNFVTLSLSELYRRNLINTMRYTLSHEYGHHETMWQAYGQYDSVYGLYSPERAANSVTSANKKLMDRLFALGEVSPGFKSLATNIQVANDQYSGTMTPAYASYNQVYYNPAGKKDQASWTQDIINFEYFSPFPDEDGKVGWQTIGKRARQALFNGRDNFQGMNNGFSANTKSLNLFRLSDKIFNEYPRLKNSNFTKNLNMGWPVSSLLYNYQVSKWLLDFRAADKIAIESGKATGEARAAFEQKYQLVLPTIKDAAFGDYLLRNGPTVGYATTTNGNAEIGITIMLGVVFLRPGLRLPASTRIPTETRAAAALLEEIDRLIGPLYERLIAKYPNLFLETDSLPKVDDYTRTLIVFDELLAATKSALNSVPNDASDPRDFFAPGIYLDPTNEYYTTAREFSKSKESFMDYQNGVFNNEGIAQNGSIEESFEDYAGDYSEFLTRSWNQLTYRPNYAGYTDLEGVVDYAQLRSHNNGWYNDASRFAAHGALFYNRDFNNAADTFLTDDGARLLMWYRETLGIGSNIDWLKTLPRQANGKVDLDALDASLVKANTLEKVYKNYRSGEYAMWGWLTKDEAARYKYIVLRSAFGDQYVPIKLKNTSNYFYYADMSNSSKRQAVPNHVQWASDWFVVGNYRNAALALGESELFFASEVGGAVTSLFGTLDDTVTERFNNDYEKVIAQVIATVDPKNQRISMRVRDLQTEPYSASTEAPEALTRRR